MTKLSKHRKRALKLEMVTKHIQMPVSRTKKKPGKQRRVLKGRI